MKFYEDDVFFGIVAVITLWVTLICTYTPDRPVAVFAAVSAASLLPAIVCRRLSWHSKGCAWLLLVCAAIIGSGVILNCWYFTTASGGTDAAPVLHNFDAELNWEFYTMSNIKDLATDRFPGFCFNRASGYPYLMRALGAVFGPSIAFLLGFNMLCVMLTVILCGSITRKCMQGHSFNTCVTPELCAMIVLASNSYFLVTGTIFIKDAVIQLLFACMIYLLIVMKDSRRNDAKTLAAAFGTILLIALVRHQLLPLLLPGFFLILFRSRQMWAKLLPLCAFTAIVYGAVMALPTHEEYDMAFSILTGPRATHPEKVTTFIVDNSRTDMIFKITGNLDQQMPWMRVLWLPVTMLCQFLIPFPWNFTRDMIYGPSQFYAHISFPGYLAGIVLCYYILFMWRRGPRLANRLLCWGIILYAVVAFHWSGSVSRYCLMFIPLAAPAISFCLLTAWRKRSLYVWASLCSVLLASVLIVCHRLSH
ncbi:MAG: hypothetical protein K2I56_08040 [Muribaculaceae bacterium]|nr:hypothetical protein [Muribaculaceae bacterium]